MALHLTTQKKTHKFLGQGYVGEKNTSWKPPETTPFMAELYRSFESFHHLETLLNDFILQITWHILNDLFFGGEKKTKKEKTSGNFPIFSVRIFSLLTEFC